MSDGPAPTPMWVTVRRYIQPSLAPGDPARELEGTWAATADDPGAAPEEGAWYTLADASGKLHSGYVFLRGNQDTGGARYLVTEITPGLPSDPHAYAVSPLARAAQLAAPGTPDGQDPDQAALDLIRADFQQRTASGLKPAASYLIELAQWIAASADDSPARVFAAEARAVCEQLGVPYRGASPDEPRHTSGEPSQAPELF